MSEPERPAVDDTAKAPGRATSGDRAAETADDLSPIPTFAQKLEGILDGVAGTSAIHGYPETPPTFAPPAESGDVGCLGPYRVVRELGRGGMGAVFLAFDTRLNRKLALKVMLPQFSANAAAKERFLREARAAAQITHDNVVTVYEADERDGVPYIAMQFLQGNPLDEYLREKGNPSIPQILRIAQETVTGLAAAHAIGLVHRDIKPGNLWLEVPHGRVKVLDFGLARPVDADIELTKSGAIVGTPAYMSPEQARGLKVDGRSDLFSLGATMYRLCTGRVPFDAPNTMAVLMALGTEEPPPVRELNPEVLPPLADLIHQLLAKNPDHRPQTAEEVVERLQLIATELGLTESSAVTTRSLASVSKLSANTAETVTADVAHPAGGKSRRRGWWIAAAFAGLLAIVAGAILAKPEWSGTKLDGSESGGRTPGDDKADRPFIPVKLDPKQLAAIEADRKAVEYVRSVGAQIQIDGVDTWFRSTAPMPAPGFRLTAVGFYGNTLLTDDDLAVFRDCVNLERLDLGMTKVTDAGLKHFQDRRGLKSLSLYLVAAVTDVGVENFKDCKNLTSLVLSGTRVTEKGLAYFKGCKRLNHLNISGNPNVTDAGLESFKECKELEQLELSFTGVTDVGLKHFKGCSSLWHIGLAGTGVTDVGMENFRSCTAVMGLNLTNTRVTNVGLGCIPNYKALKRLYLAGLSVTDHGLAPFQECTMLKELDLTDTGATDKGLAYFKENTALTKVWLRGVSMTDEGLKCFDDCKALAVLGVGGTLVTAKAVQEFARDHPQCEIYHDSGIIKPPAAIDPDRAGAAYVLSIGGTVLLNDEPQEIKAVADLPKTRFTLTGVILGGNKAVTDVGLASLKDCKALTVLHLYETGVTNAGLVHFKGCRNVMALYLHGTKVTDAGLANFAGCGNHLTSLNLAGTGVTDEGVAHFQGCRRLHGLGLNGLAVTDVGLAHFKNCKGIVVLELNGTRVTDKGLANFEGCQAVTRLLLSHTDVTDAGFANFKMCKGLTEVDLGGTRVSDAGLEQFKECKGLKSLHLYTTDLTDKGLAHLKDCKALMHLVLHETGVTGAGLANFKDCKDLVFLDVAGTKVTPKAIEEFRRALPPCQIRHDGDLVQPKK